MAYASGNSTAVLDISDPLYILPSDAPGINLISEQLIGTENYGIWSRAMIIALRAKNKLAIIDGSCTRPELDAANLKQWERCNAIVLSWIMNGVSKEIFYGIVYFTDAKSVWDDLKERFDKVNGSRIFSLHREIGRLSQGQNTISVYYSKIRQLWDEYSSLVTLPSCSCESAKQYMEHDQQLKLLQFLMGLNDSYSQIRSHILMMHPLPSVGQAFAIVTQEECHRSLSSMGPILAETPNAAFYSSQERRRNTLFCEHCKWPGHTKSRCYKLVGYPPNHKMYKGKPQGWNTNDHKATHHEQGKFGKNMANMTVSDVVPDAVSNQENVPGISFTPDQYAALLKLLEKESSTDTVIGSANMAGPMHWEDNGDW
ncbi:uncharacterized protein [Henckelia pumila]|uniref:uncharacterized protein n=1 Tax=Henckelia pumila TaxID=405737 RepID=UPI003C6E4646